MESTKRKRTDDDVLGLARDQEYKYVVSNSKLHTKTCIVCLEPASCFCVTCAENPVPLTRANDVTYYCGIVCQNAHSATHKATCDEIQTLRQLYNAGHLLQHVFYIFSGEVYRHSIERMGTRNSVHGIQLHIKTKQTTQSFFPFPEWICHTRRLKTALLVTLASIEALAVLSELAKDALSDIAEPISELHFTTSPPSILFRTIWHTSSNSYSHSPTHSVLLINLLATPSKSYILDFTGSQYGWSDISPVHRMEDYVPRKMLSIQSVTSVGYCRLTSEMMISDPAMTEEQAKSSVERTHPMMITTTAVNNPRLTAPPAPTPASTPTATPSNRAPSLPLKPKYPNETTLSLSTKLTSILRTHLPHLPNPQTPDSASPALSFRSRLKSLLILPRAEFKYHETILLNKVTEEFKAVVAQTMQEEFDKGTRSSSSM